MMVNHFSITIPDYRNKQTKNSFLCVAIDKECREHVQHFRSVVHEIHLSQTMSAKREMYVILQRTLIVFSVRCAGCFTDYSEHMLSFV